MQESRIKNRESRIEDLSRVSRLASCILLLVLVLACQTLISSPSPASDTWSPDTLLPDTPVPTSTKQGTPASPVVADRHRRIFQTVWRTVKRNYIYDDYNGIDWDAVKDEFAPRVEAASDDLAFWLVMQDMIWRLNDEHSIFLTPAEAMEEDQMLSGDLDYVGIGVYVTVPDNATYGVVLFSFPGSPAEAADIRAHDRILSIDGIPPCCDAFGNDRLDLLLGEAETSVALTLQYPGEAERAVEMQRARIQTQVPILSRCIATEGQQDVGYLLIPTLWDDTIAERTRETLGELLTGDALLGLVIDMRINGGGAYTELYDLLSLFTEGEVGAFLRRGSERSPLTLEANPLHNSQDIPLVILVGRDTESYAEIFSGALQATGRARLVGRATAGNVESVYPYDLEDGSRLWLAEETFVPLTGTPWEEEGVQPDVLVDGEWEDFTDENDPYIAAALAILLGEK